MITGLRIHDDGRVQIADAPSDFGTGEFLTEILPSLRPGSGAEHWELKDGTDGRVLRLELTLEENQVRSRDDLYLVAKAGTNGLVKTTCSRCGAQNLPGAKFCSTCGHELVGPPSQGPLLPIELTNPKDQNEDLAFEVVSPEGKRQDCEAPADTMTENLVRDLADAFSLAKVDAKGRAMEYRLHNEGTGEALDGKKSLAKNGVESGGRFVLAHKTSLLDALHSVKPPAKESVTPKPDVPEPEDLRFQVVTVEGRSRRCEAPADTSTREFLNDVMDRFALPKVGPNNRKLAYVLMDELTQRSLDPAKTLAQNGVADGQRLLLRAEAPAIAVVEGWFARHGKMAALAALGLVLVVGLLWAVFRPKPPESVKPAGIRKDPHVPTIAVMPGRYEVLPGGSVQFAAHVTDSSRQTVHWTINPTVGTMSPDGLYVAPATVAAVQEVGVEAASDDSPPVRGRATLTLLPSTGGTTASLRIVPAGASLNGGDTARFTVGGAAVQWSVSPAVGTMSQDGVYTAPATVTKPQRVRVIASGDTQAIASVSLQPVAVTVVTANDDGNGPMRFSATVRHTKNTGVTWSITPQSGSVSQEGMYARDPKQKEATDLTVTATSVADPSKSASTSVHLAAVRGAPSNPNPAANVKISLNPFEHVVLANQTVVLSATVTGATDKTLTWASSGLGTIYGNGLFVAPKNAPAGDHVIHIVATSHADPSKRAEGEFVLRVPPPYAGAKQGTLVWTGNLDKNAVLTIEGTKASTGAVMGELPGVAVAIRIETPKCALVASPGPGNGWKTVAIRAGTKLRSLTMSWSVVP